MKGLFHRIATWIGALTGRAWWPDLGPDVERALGEACRSIARNLSGPAGRRGASS